MSPPRVQGLIGDILSAYDELIENSEQQIEVFQNIRTSIFKEWFVNLRFPNNNGLSLDDLITVGGGWNIEKLSDIVSIKRGEVSAKNSIKEGRYPFFTASKNSPERINKYSYDTNAILITITGHFLSFLYRGKFEASDHCFVLQVKNKNLFYFLFEQLKIKLQILHKEDSGILKTLRIQRLLNLNFPIPDDTILDKFNNICEDIQLKIENLNKRVESSENVKKHLLNKLFSQKIRVN